MHDPWTQALEFTRQRSPATFEQWFSSVQFESLKGDCLHLTARNEFVQDWVHEHFLPSLTAKLSELLCQSVNVKWSISGELPRPISLPPQAQAERTPGAATSQDSSGETATFQQASGVVQGSATARPALVAPASAGRRMSLQSVKGGSVPPSSRSGLTPSIIGKLNPKSTFENFVIGHSNELPYAAAFASAGGGGPIYNPLFIAGGTGLGKTHLMHAIAHKVLAERPYSRGIYVSAEHFTNEFIEALQNRTMDAFRGRYRSECDLLLIDDVQFLAGREQTQEEFFHTFNALHDRGVPIILTSDKYPQQLQRMPDRLVSRFTSGLVADVQAPRLETRVAILKKKAQLEQIALPDAVAVLLAQKNQSNVRELEGALIRLAAKSSLLGRPIDIEFAEVEMALVTPQSQKIVCVSDIQKAVCSHFRVTSAELLSKDRHRSVAFARQVAMYLCRQRLKSSFPELGRAFGNRDHTTVMSAVRKVESLRKTDPQVDAHLEAIERELTQAK